MLGTFNLGHHNIKYNIHIRTVSHLTDFYFKYSIRHHACLTQNIVTSVMKSYENTTIQTSQHQHAKKCSASSTKKTKQIKCIAIWNDTYLLKKTRLQNTNHVTFFVYDFFFICFPWSVTFITWRASAVEVIRGRRESARASVQAHSRLARRLCCTAVRR